MATQNAASSDREMNSKIGARARRGLERNRVGDGRLLRKKKVGWVPDQGETLLAKLNATDGQSPTATPQNFFSALQTNFLSALISLTQPTEVQLRKLSRRTKKQRDRVGLQG